MTIKDSANVRMAPARAGRPAVSSGVTWQLVGGSLTMVGSPLTMLPGALTTCKGPLTVVNGWATPVKGSMTIVNGPLTVIGGPMTMVNAPLTLCNAPMTMVNGPSTPFKTAPNRGLGGVPEGCQPQKGLFLTIFDGLGGQTGLFDPWDVRGKE